MRTAQSRSRPTRFNPSTRSQSPRFETRRGLGRAVWTASTPASAEGAPERVRVFAFIDDTQGKLIPYGVYNLAQNTGWVNGR